MKNEITHNLKQSPRDCLKNAVMKKSDPPPLTKTHRHTNTHTNTYTHYFFHREAYVYEFVVQTQILQLYYKSTFPGKCPKCYPKFPELVFFQNICKWLLLHTTDLAKKGISTSIFHKFFDSTMNSRICKFGLIIIGNNRSSSSRIKTLAVEKL